MTKFKTSKEASRAPPEFQHVALLIWPKPTEDVGNISAFIQYLNTTGD